MLFSCSKQLLELEHGLYSSENYGSLNELNLLDNNTFCTYYAMECIAMPQMNIGTFQETNDSITFRKDKNSFFNKNIRYEKTEKDKFVTIQPYILVDYLIGNRNWTLSTALSVSVETNGEIIKIDKKHFNFPTIETIRLNKANMTNVDKLLITDESINHTFEIEYNNSLNKILTPTGYMNMNCYDSNSNVSSIRIAKFEDKIEFIHSDKEKVKYKLHKQ